MLTTTHSPQKFSGLSQSGMKKEGQPCTANIILLKCPLDLPVSNFPSKSPLLFYGLYSLPRQLSPCSYIIQPSSSLCLYIFTGGGWRAEKGGVHHGDTEFLHVFQIYQCLLPSVKLKTHQISFQTGWFYSETAIPPPHWALPPPTRLSLPPHCNQDF